MNDLDLVLKRPNEKSALLGNLNKKGDHVNTNERISIKKPEKGIYKVKVKANALLVSGRQRFAMVLTYAGKPLSTKEIQLLKTKS